MSKMKQLAGGGTNPSIRKKYEFLSKLILNPCMFQDEHFKNADETTT